jgi:exosortase E/protease (VPEID-CTERM system)
LFHSLLGRLYLFAIIYALEAVLVIGGFRIQYSVHPALLPVAIVSLAVFLGLGLPWLKQQRENLPFGYALFGGFLACVVATIFINAAANLPGASQELRSAAPFIVFAAILLEVPLLAFACIPLRTWIRMLRATSPLWLYALLAGWVAWSLNRPLKSLWSVSDGECGSVLQIATFASVRTVLHWVLPGSFADAASFTVGTPRFSLMVLQACSGLEGMGLMLAFSLVWLWYLRRQCRFPQALLLIPCALGCMWLMNVVRLSALIFIGDAFGSEVAMVGFHSQFGWIAFTVVALAFCVVAEKLPWARKFPLQASFPDGGSMSEGLEAVADAPEHENEYLGESPAIRAYLVPFLAILAATFVSKAASGNFEWLYPLRFVAAALALCYCWPQLKKLNWRFGWVAPVAGVAVFLMWIAPTWWAGHFAASPIGPALAALSPVPRWSWISFRVAAAVITVPLAEELAFRGYLARRFMNWDFDSVPFTGLTALSVCLSSAAFGLMHGQHWMAGILAGFIYALVLRWRGRIGDAVVAHAVSNLLLAIWVISFGDWAQW